MQYDQLGAGAYPIGRTGEADAGGDVKLGGGFAVIAIRTLVDEFHHQRVGPENWPLCVWPQSVRSIPFMIDSLNRSG